MPRLPTSLASEIIDSQIKPIGLIEILHLSIFALSIIHQIERALQLRRRR